MKKAKKSKRKKKATTKKGAVRRDATGRFLPGTRGGPGNPSLMRIAKLRSEIQQAVTPAEIRTLFRRLLTKAKAGDVESAKLVLNYAVGKPIATPAGETHGGIAVDLDVTSLQGCSAAQRAVLNALAAGKVTPEDAVKVSSIIESARRAIETVELEQRIALLETSAEARRQE